MSGDNPVAGTFTSNGRTYSISYVGTYNSSSGNQPATLTLNFNRYHGSGLKAVVYNGYSFTQSQGSELDTINIDQGGGTSSTNVNTEYNDTPNWRHLALSTDITDHITEEAVSAQATPFFEWQITCTSNPPSGNSFGVNITLVQGSTSSMETYVDDGAFKYGQTAPWYATSSATGMPNGVSEVSQSPGPPYLVSASNVGEGPQATASCTLYEQFGGQYVGVFYAEIAPLISATLTTAPGLCDAGEDWIIYPYHVVGP